MIRPGEYIDPLSRVQAWLHLIEQEILRRGVDQGDRYRPPAIEIRSELPEDIIDLLDDSLKENGWRLHRRVEYNGRILSPRQRRHHPAVRDDGEFYFFVVEDQPCKHHFTREYMSKNEFCSYCGIKPGPDDHVWDRH